MRSINRFIIVYSIRTQCNYISRTDLGSKITSPTCLNTVIHKSNSKDIWSCLSKVQKVCSIYSNYISLPFLFTIPMFTREGAPERGCALN